MDSRINVLLRLGSPREKRPRQLQCSVFISVSSVNTKKKYHHHTAHHALPPESCSWKSQGQTSAVTAGL